MNKVDLEWASYLIGKIKAHELRYEENKTRLGQRQAVDEAAKIVGDTAHLYRRPAIVIRDEDE